MALAAPTLALCIVTYCHMNLRRLKGLNGGQEANFSAGWLTDILLLIDEFEFLEIAAGRIPITVASLFGDQILDVSPLEYTDPDIVTMGDRLLMITAA